MGKDENFDRLRAEMTLGISIVGDAGGGVSYMFEYLKYIDRIRSRENQTATVLEGKDKFRRRFVQMAAIGAVKDANTIKTSGLGSDDVDNGKLARDMLSLSRQAYVSAAGHFTEDKLSGIPDPSDEGKERRLKAAIDWDRYIDDDYSKLGMLSLFGHEDGQKRLNKLEYIKGFLSIAFFIFCVFLIYQNWGKLI